MRHARTPIGSLLSMVISISAATLIKGGKFTDDMGKEYDFEAGAKYTAHASIGALSLYRLGLRDEITTVYGLWSIRGSDLDVKNPDAVTRYPESDPSSEEINWLATKNNMSPGCYTNPRGCSRWDNGTIFEKYQDEFDYILFIGNGNNRNMKTITNETGIPVVFVDTFFDYHPDCRGDGYEFDEVDNTKCFGRSMIDIVNRIEDLAIAMGIDIDTDQVKADKKASCDAAATFTATMKKKQEEGLRFITTVNAVKKDDEGNDFFEFRSVDPVDLWVPRTLEELGMPLLHSDEGSLTMVNISTRVTGDEYFVDCPAGQISQSCNDNTLYPVDFWLFDSRSYLNVIEAGDGVFESLFPDKAILAGQHWHYARNDGAITYDTITRILNEMTARVKDAKRMHPETECTPIDPKTAHTAQEGGGLDRNQFICYNEELIQKEYLTCGSGNQEKAGADTSGSSSKAMFATRAFLAAVAMFLFI